MAWFNQSMVCPRCNRPSPLLMDTGSPKTMPVMCSCGKASPLKQWKPYVAPKAKASAKPAKRKARR